VSRRSLVNVLLALMVAAAAAWVYWRPQPVEPAAFPLIPNPVDSLQRIEVDRPGKPVIVLSREQSPWRLQSPVRGRAEEVGVAKLLDLARARSAQRLPAADLGRFELDQPWATLRFDGYPVELGMANPITRELYARSGEYVLTLPTRLAAAVPAEPAKLLSHRLFAAEEQPVAFRLHDFSVRQVDGRWQLEPRGSSVSQDDLARWVDHWRLANSIVTQAAAEGPAQATIEVELKGGVRVQVEVRARIPNLVLRRADEGLEYHLPARLAEVLLARPDAIDKPS